MSQELSEDLSHLRDHKPLSIQHLSIERFVEMIETIPGFAFARISDGGFFCLQGRRGANCDGSPYSSEQAVALREMLLDRTIFHGITSIALHVARASDWLQEKKIDVEWYDADVMNKASDTGMLFPFIECLRERKSLVIGPSHLTRMDGFPIAAYITCHPTHAFEEVDALEAEIVYRTDLLDVDTLLLSAGQGASPTLVSRLHAIYPDKVVLDCGSLWDPYVHVFSRSGHKKRGWEEYKRLGWKNFRQDIEKW